MVNLHEKKILFISVKFFGYEDFIKGELEKQGATVFSFDERPSNGFITKALLRINKSYLKPVLDSYFKKILDSVAELDLDYFLLIKGEATPLWFIEKLRESHSKIQLIYYTYDSFDNSSNALDILPLFDKKYTFDPSDAKKFNISFRPLFFITEYSKVRSYTAATKYSMCFIGTAHSDRYLIAESLKSELLINRLKSFVYYFSPSKLLFVFNKLTKRSFKNFQFSKISFRSLKHNDIIEIYDESIAILDINHHRQTGLTMRTFEVLGAGRKLITTNADIKKYPFYNETNILLVDRENPKIDLSFFNQPVCCIDEELLYSMSITGWIQEIFNKPNEIWRFIQ